MLGSVPFFNTEMRYWWVNQNQTYRHEVSGGYLWSPKRNAKGARNPFYESMREVAPGDLVFSFVNTRIPAVPPENSIPGDVRVVLTQNSNSDVVMMKTTEHGQRGDVAEKLCTPEVWGVFIQCQVGPDLVIVRSVALQDTTQVRLAEHDDMIETFTS